VSDAECGQVAITNQSVDGHIGHGESVRHLPDPQEAAVGAGRFAHIGSLSNNCNNFNDRNILNSNNKRIRWHRGLSARSQPPMHEGGPPEHSEDRPTGEEGPEGDPALAGGHAGRHQTDPDHGSEEEPGKEGNGDVSQS
jgi:hypothetical protein